ncbi:MAG: amidohydrolase family protein [Thermoplasmatota archaeon]
MQPFLCNCHTHIGDAFIRLPRQQWTVEELVAPPDGYKHRRLREATPAEVRRGMEQAMAVMGNCGTTHFIDFREGGREGVRALRSLSPPPRALVLGRPAQERYDEKEMEDLLEMADGVGLSGIADWEYEEICRVAEHVHRAGKLFALHVSEHRRENMEDVLALRPSFLVHLCAAAARDLRMVADAGVPVVVCPRANAFFGLRPPLESLLELDVPVMLGTDNAMITPPDIRQEMRYVQRIFGVSEAQVAAMVSDVPRKCLNASAHIHQPD